ncbi:MAG: hypothetical protein CMJ35_04535 [Phycisphaerae bacterium]|nr:hypothetical protein [Phycisphaerae bacterium]MBM90866.1 hypothetical protein [Phycisphaerae bacterium]|tara:strand:- start:2241 stop:2930 length:690 start_codon:yes stop_codon:yes gene_type:complete
MSKSHICPSCLTELGRVRVSPDPHYGLAVVVCTKCQQATVRVKHPDRVFWKQFHQLRSSLVRLWLAMLFSALSIGSLVGMAFWVQSELTLAQGRLVMPDLANPSVATQLLIAGIIVLLTGCITRAIYAHRKFIEVVGLFLLLTFFFVTIDASFGGVMRFVRDLVGSDVTIDLPSGRELQRRLLTLMVFIPVLLAGMGLGELLNRMLVKGERKRISRIRKRLRRRQSRQD